MRLYYLSIFTLITINFNNEITCDDHQLDDLENIYEKISTIYSQTTRKARLFKINWSRLIEPKHYKHDGPIEAFYDFIIIGAGSTGSVIANRLSENPQWKILLLEAGNGENLFSLLPLGAPVMSLTPYNWGHIMEYQHGIGNGMINNRMLWPRGKALGGTTVINYMIYTRGNRLDYDRWSELGLPGWSWNEVLPYFLKSENATLNNADYRFHNTGGLWSVEDVYESKITRTFFKAADQLGLPYIDYNANVQGLGVSLMQANILHGRRHTTASAFLDTAKHRPNLHIISSAFVTKLLINPKTKECFGVKYERDGKEFHVGITREVILSAGTFHSPQLLMLSGIGPERHLHEVGIKTIQNLPVGQFLQDHLCFPGISFTINQDIVLSADLLLNPKIIFEYLFNGTGPYTSLGGCEGLGYIKTPLSEEVEDIPDIELLFVDGCLSTDYGEFTRKWMNIRDDVYDGLYRPLHNKPCWQIMPMLLHPKSFGYVKLASKNPHQFPLLYGNFFTDPQNQDINTFVAAIRFIQTLAKTKPFQRFGSTLNQNRHPGCEDYEFDSDDYWRCTLRSIAVTLHHQIGTCRMGPLHDPRSVVNHVLKVHGINRLRVADSSVIPFAIGAHTNAPAVMIGEKVSDIIKQNWGVSVT